MQDVSPGLIARGAALGVVGGPGEPSAEGGGEGTPRASCHRTPVARMGMCTWLVGSGVQDT